MGQGGPLVGQLLLQGGKAAAQLPLQIQPRLPLKGQPAAGPGQRGRQGQGDEEQGLKGSPALGGGRGLGRRVIPDFLPLAVLVFGRGFGCDPGLVLCCLVLGLLLVFRHVRCLPIC